MKHTVFASSLAVSGQQSHFGDRAATEDDYRYATAQYGMHKSFNEFQAQDYVAKHGMVITGIRPANVTGPDKVRGSVDHVNLITQPARGKPISFPFADAMRCPIHVDDIAEVFVRVLLSDKPARQIYNSGGVTISLGDIAKMVREFLPDAQISFDKPTGGKAASGNYLIDNTRLVSGIRRAVPAVSRARAADHQRGARAGRPAAGAGLTLGGAGRAGRSGTG